MKSRSLNDGDNTESSTSATRRSNQKIDNCRIGHRMSGASLIRIAQAWRHLLLILVFYVGHLLVEKLAEVMQRAKNKPLSCDDPFAGPLVPFLCHCFITLFSCNYSRGKLCVHPFHPSSNGALVCDPDYWYHQLSTSAWLWKRSSLLYSAMFVLIVFRVKEKEGPLGIQGCDSSLVILYHSPNYHSSRDILINRSIFIRVQGSSII